MATTLYDPAAGWRSYVLQARTDAAGSAVDDAGGEDLRTMLDAFYTEGVAEADAFGVLEDSPTGMTVLIGSGTAKADHAVIDGDISGQGAYLVRMEDATVTLTVPAADLSNPRIDEVYVIVQDNAYDSSSRVLPRIAYRDGTPASSPDPPGPDAAWDAYLLVATIAVKAGETEITDAEITDERVFVGVSLGGAERLQTNTDTTVTDSTVVNVPTGGKVDVSFGGLILYRFSNTELEIASRNITNVGTVDGVDVSAHNHDGTNSTALPADVATQFEVDNSTEVASVALTGTLANVAAVTLSIPAGWGSWKCEAWASYVLKPGLSDADFSTVINIDGTDQQIKAASLTAGADQVQQPDAVGGRRTGITTTGSRTVALRAREDQGAITATDIYLYARAVRTS